MTSLSTFIRSTDPFFIGFNNLWSELERVNDRSMTNSSFPPYDIKRDKDSYQINMALAGFTEDDLSVELKDNTLTIEGNKESGNPDAKEVADNYIYKGIANRKFKRAFTLADTVEVKDVKLAHGVLTVDLENIIPEEQKPKKFKINSGGIVDKVKKTLLTE